MSSDANADTDTLIKLPSDIISHILSRLPTKDAVRTSTLSHKWKLKWISIYAIDVEKQGGAVEYIVESIVFKTKGHDIKKFRLSYLGYRGLHDEKILQSIENLSRRGLESLEIFANLMGPHFTDELFSSPLLKFLKLDIPASLTVSTASWSTNLTDLTLSNISIVRKCSASHHDLVLKFQVLKTLTLESCCFVDFKNLHFQCPALRHVDVKNFCNPSTVEDSRINFMGAKLKIFKYTGWGVIDIDFQTSTVLCMSISTLSSERVIAQPAQLLLKRCSTSLTHLTVAAGILEAIHREGALISYL